MAFKNNHTVEIENKCGVCGRVFKSYIWAFQLSGPKRNTLYNCSKECNELYYRKIPIALETYPNGKKKMNRRKKNELL